MKKRYTAFRLLKHLLAGLFLFVALYLLAVWLVPKITVQKQNYPSSQAAYTIYLLTNGVHTDVVLPVHSGLVQWDTLVPFKNTLANDSTAQWLAFGWGDKGFYLNTPTWGDLTFSTAFKAASGLSSTAMHTTYYKNMKEGSDCVKIMVSAAQLQLLTEYIMQSFAKDSTKHFVWIPTTAVYGRRDAFYEAKGTYSLFTTCNSWTNAALKTSGLPACLWTALDIELMKLYNNLTINSSN